MNKTFKKIKINNRTFQLLTLPGTNLYVFEIEGLVGANVERAVHRKNNTNIYGLSHLVEHLSFRTSLDYSAEELHMLLKTEGTYNAYTDYDNLPYYFKTTMDQAWIGTRLVCNYALNDLTRVSEKEFEIERKVVINEANQGNDDEQMMFYNNVIPTSCEYHKEDNVIGDPNTIKTFTLDAARSLKQMFLSPNNLIYNITYDPMMMSEDEILDLVNDELDRFPLSASSFDDIKKDYYDMLRAPIIGQSRMDNGAKQFMTWLFIGSNKTTNGWTTAMANSYLHRYASSTSLDDVIREQNGLTYDVGFYETSVSYTPYTVFCCDVTKGTEDHLMRLFKRSINDSVNNFTVQEYEKLLKTIRLKRVMRDVNQESYQRMFSLAFRSPEIFEGHWDSFAENIDKTSRILDDDFATYDKLKDYMVKTQDMVNREVWSIVNN